MAAIRAAQLGARVTIIERKTLGGVCLNWGCIPSKTLLSVIELGDKLKKADDLGLVLSGQPRYDLARMVARKNKVVASLVKGIATLFNAWKIEVVEGRGRLVDARTIAVTASDGTERQVQADAVVIATNHRAVDLGGERADPRSFDWGRLQTRLAALGMLCS